MIVNFEALTETARVWIYQCNRSFSDSEIEEISEKLTNFLDGWTAHGADLKSGFEIKYKAVSKNTIVFNNLVNSKAEYLEFWEVPASESWHSRFV